MSTHPQLRYEVSVGGRTRDVRVQELDGGLFRLWVDDDDPVDVEAFESEPGTLSLLLHNESWEAGVVPTDEGFSVSVLGIPHDVEVVDPKRKALRTISGAGGNVVRTQMPGRIVRIMVEDGQAVKQGDPVVVVEAMKMENELKAATDGVVKRVCVATGDLVEARAVLVELA